MTPKAKPWGRLLIAHKKQLQEHQFNDRRDIPVPQYTIAEVGKPRLSVPKKQLVSLLNDSEGEASGSVAES